MTASSETYVVDTQNDDIRANVLHLLDCAWAVNGEVSLDVKPGAVDLGRYVMHWYVSRRRDGFSMHSDTAFIVGATAVSKVLTIWRNGDEFCRVAYLRNVPPSNEEES